MFSADATIAETMTLLPEASGVVLAGSHEAGALDLGSGPLPYGGDADAFVLRLRSELSVAAAETFGGGRDQGVADLTRDATGAPWMVGTAQLEIDLGDGPLSVAGTGGDTDVFVARLDGATLAPSRGRLYGDAAEQQGEGITATANGMVFMADARGSPDFGGGPLMSAGEADIYVVKIDAP